MSKFFQDKATSNTMVSQTLGNVAGEYLDREVWDTLTKKLVDAWFKEYGADVIKELAPKKVKDTVAKIIEDKLAEKFWSNPND